MRNNRISRLADAVLHALFTLFALSCVYPVLLVAAVSVSDAKSVAQHGFRLIPEHFTLGAYRLLFTDSGTVFRAYGVTLTVVAAGTLLGVLMMAMYAYPLSRRDFPYRGIFSFIIFFTMLFTGGVVSFYLTYIRVLHLQDSLLALILPLLINPFNLIVMRSFFQSSIHPALIEAAKIDGSGEMHLFLRIILPLSLPLLATMGLLTGLVYWNDWFNSLLFINKPHLYSLQFMMMKAMLTLQYIKQQMNLGNTETARSIMQTVPEEGIRMAMVIIAIGPIVAAYPFVQRYFVQGMTLGSVKG